MKKMLVVVVALFLIFSMLFSACGANNQNAQDQSSAQQSNSPAAQATTAQPQNNEKVTVKLASQWWLEPGRKELYEGFKKDFEASHPQITIEPLAMSYSEYFDKIKVLLGSNDAPQIFYATLVQLKLWKEMGYLEALDGYIDTNKLLSEVSSPESQKQAQIDGKMYALYLEACPYSGLIYNKKLLQDAGVAVPTTPEELLDAAKKLTKGTEQYGFITADSADNPTHIMQENMIIIHGFGGKIINDKGEFGVADPEFIEGVKFLKTMIDSGAVPKNMVYNTQRKLFFAGKAAMCLDGGYFVTWAQSENPEVGKNLDVAYAPFKSKNNPIDLTYFSVNSKATEAQKKASIEVLNAYMGADFQEKWIRQCGYPVTMKNAVTDEFRKEFPWFKIYEDTAAYGIPLSVKGYETQSDELRRVVADYLLKVILSNESVEKAMSDCKTQLEALVK